MDILKVWGCLTKVAILEPKRKKIGPKTINTIFIGYTRNSNANGFLVINFEVNEISNKTIIKVRDATYFEGLFPFITKVSN